MKKAVCLVLLWFIPLFSTEHLEIKREDESKLIAYLDIPEQVPFSIALFIPGAQKESALQLHEVIKSDLLQIGRAALTIEKRGISPEQIDEQEFIRSLSLDERMADHLLLLKQLKVSGWNGKIAILGQGDGGRIGASLANKTHPIQALVLIASGGGWPPLEEALYSFRSELADEGYSPQYIHGFLVQAKREFAQALKTPKIEQKAFGFTYKYWKSLLTTNLLQDLALLTCPIYSINGVEDDRVPILSVDAMAKCLKDKLTLVRKEKRGREIIQDPNTYKEAISWLELQ